MNTNYRSIRVPKSFQYGLLAPLFFVLGLVLFYPISFSIFVSLHEYRITNIDNARFVGLENYTRLVGNDAFATAMSNTIVFVVSAVLIELVLGFLLAFLLFRQRKFKGVLRSVLLTPMFVTPIAVGLMFRFLLNPQLGLIPYLLGYVDLQVDFFGPHLALFTIIMIDVWQWTPFMILLLLAGMESLPEEPFEAAFLDGAGARRLIRHFLLPMLRPTILAAIIIRSLDAFKVFEYVWAITRGGPGQRTEVMLYHIYKQGFRFFEMGRAAAMGYYLVIVILCLVLAVYLALTVVPQLFDNHRSRRIRAGWEGTDHA